MFRVSLGALDEIAKKLYKDSEQFRFCAEQMHDIISSLDEFSYMDESKQSLMHMKVCIEEEADQTALLGQTLDRVETLYWQTDQRAEDYCEEASRRMPREEAAYQDIGWVAELAKLLL